MKTTRPAGSILAPDDLRTGMYVAIHAGMPLRHATLEQAATAIVEAKLADARGPSPGMPLLVMSISLPFVACGWLQPGGQIAGPVLLDIRRYSLQRVSRHFVNTIRNFPVLSASHTAGRDQAATTSAEHHDTTTDTIA